MDLRIQVWVLLLIGWISTGSDARQDYIIEIIDQILVALFCVVSRVQPLDPKTCCGR